MLKRIPTDQIRMGMYVQGFVGSWFDHPFWRCKFLLTDPEDVEKIRNSAVDLVIIDVVKGAAPEVQAPPAPPPVSAIPEPVRKSRATPPLVMPEASTQQSLRNADEARAKLVMNRSKKVMKDFYASVRLGKAVRCETVMPVVEDITEAIMRNARSVLNVARLKSKDEYTYFHSVAVCTLMVNLGRQMGKDEAELHQMGLAGLLHDIGKVIIPEDVLNKPGALSDAEFSVIRSHPEHGHKILMEAGDVPDMALNVCLRHHERMDGRGYPFGLSADQLGTADRLGAICDVYDALTSNRAYKEAWTPADTIGAMRGWEGHFDPDLMFRFMQSIGVFPPGMLVQLRSNRLAVVLDNGRRASRPRVCAFYSTRNREFIDRGTSAELGPHRLGRNVPVTDAAQPAAAESGSRLNRSSSA
jgi:HD-GYP domain-containing protein (c-di-GMP phosphodiesterase class II)